MAQDLTVRLPGGKVLLDHVSFPIPERSLVGVIGPSGAGKLTLLGALTGTRPATEGAVLYDNRDLYTHYAELRHRIGLVPQDNILHEQLKPKRALRYAAELRFPGDTSRAERDRRVDEVIDELSLTAHCKTRTAAMSGGQQKRVNVALELLTKPSLLFLDEPTSGLDPGLDKSVMELMSGLAKDGRTVIIVTHSVINLDVCDRLLVLVPGGRVAFYGPPADGPAVLRQARLGRGVPVLRSRAGPGLGRGLPAVAVLRRARGGRPGPAGARGGPRVARPPARATRCAGPGLHALPALPVCHRLGPQLPDRAGGHAPGDRGAAAGGPVPGGPGRASRGRTPAPAPYFWSWSSGPASSGRPTRVRELVKERPIYARERAAGLSSGTYLFSKLIVLGVISGLQALVLVVLGLAGRQMPAHGSLIKSLPLVEIALAIVVLSVASMALGLLVSSIVSTSEKAMPLLVMLAIVQVILSGGVLPLNGKVGLNQLSWITPSRWGFASTASTVKLNVISPPVSRAARPGVGPQAGHLAAGHGADGGAFPGVHPHRLAAPGRPQPGPQAALIRSRAAAAPVRVKRS